MEWLTSIRTAIDYMEEHLEDNISAQDVADRVYLSPFFLQRGFSLMTGYGIGEYIRNRRLYQAALDLKETEDKVIDIALRYCYETPESFTKAFSRFHGVTPSQVRDGAVGKVFLPLTIKLSVQGGSQMDYKFDFRDAFHRVVNVSESASNALDRYRQKTYGKKENKKSSGHKNVTAFNAASGFNMPKMAGKMT